MATAFAVFCATDNTLTFYKRDVVPNVGDTFEGKLVSSVHTGFETDVYTSVSMVPWESDKFFTVSFVDTISPISTAYWFRESWLENFNGNNLDTSNVTNMEYMFSVTTIVDLDLSMLDTRNVENMNYMFHECCDLQNLNVSTWDTSKVTDMSGMFYCCCTITSLDVSNFNTISVTNMRQMFYNCTELVYLDLIGFNTRNVSDTFSMFGSCFSLKTIYVSYGWDMSNVTTSTYMFDNCTSLVGAVPYDKTKTDATMANYTTGYFTEKAIQMLIKNTTLYNIADEIRILYGTEETMTPAVMTENLGNANTEVDEQTDLIKRILKALGMDTPSTPTLISFTIDGTEYQAEEGMTWAGWCESEYNTDGYYVGSVPVSGDVICIKGSDNYTWKLMYNANIEELWEATPTDIITNNLYCTTERLEFAM